MSYHSTDFVRAVQSLCPGLMPRTDFEVINDGTGPHISAWHRQDIPQPSQEAIEAIDTDALPPPVPMEITQRQARLALLNAGLLDQVESLVKAAGGATQIAWDYASVIRRDDPLIAAIGTTLNLTSAQIDALFTQAAAL